jgi:hypothetical protein
MQVVQLRLRSIKHVLRLAAKFGMAIAKSQAAARIQHQAAG